MSTARVKLVRVSQTTTWTVGGIEILRVPYFDIGIDPASIDLVGVADTVAWADPWLTDGQPTVGQAFWVIRSGDTTLVVDPCGASDDFLRTGPDAVGHQEAAFAALGAAGVEREAVDIVVLTHLDGIGMAALADGGPAGEEQWTPAFPNAGVVVSEAQYWWLDAPSFEPSGMAAFTQLDAAGMVLPTPTPSELAPGLTLRLTADHGPGHCCVEIGSPGDRAVMIGHLAISPLHAARGEYSLHVDAGAAWDMLQEILHDASSDGELVMGSLWPAPGAVRVTATDPFVLEPVGS